MGGCRWPAPCPPPARPHRVRLGRRLIHQSFSDANWQQAGIRIGPKAKVTATVTSMARFGCASVIIFFLDEKDSRGGLVVAAHTGPPYPCLQRWPRLCPPQLAIPKTQLR